MPKANNRNIYEERPWLNDDVQNRTVLRQIVDGGGSNITVEEITITENDTYTAPAGKAYSPVIVNVAGGSSDFSTAEVYYLNKKTSFLAYFPIAYYDEYQGEVTAYSNSVQTIAGGDAHDTYQVILYKGACLADFTNATGSISITGDATNDGGYITITGDCEITVN